MSRIPFIGKLAVLSCLVVIGCFIPKKDSKLNDVVQNVEPEVKNFVNKSQQKDKDEDDPRFVRISNEVFLRQ